MMQYPLYASYPTVYPFYNYFGSGYAFGQRYGNCYGYQPWTAPQGNPWFTAQSAKWTTENNAIANTNGYCTNYQQVNPKQVYPQYNLYQQPWNTYAQTNWLNPQQTYNQMNPWTPYYNYNQWPSMHMNFNHGMYYSWPLMSYYTNQMMFPNYLWPSPAYWAVQKTIEVPSSESKRKNSYHPSDSKTLNVHVTSSDVIRDYNLPPVVAKKTRSDIPRPTVDISEIEESDKTKDDMELPYLFRVSDTSIKQIASSRSFGPSMVYNTDSDNKPLTAN